MLSVVCFGVFCLSASGWTIKEVKPGEDVFAYITRGEREL